MFKYSIKRRCPLCPQDVTPYMNPCPYTVSPNTHISQVFNLFRTMGLRHLPVVNAVGEVSSHVPKELFCSKEIKFLRYGPLKDSTLLKSRLNGW